MSPNVYVIADENRRGVPNVGIVVGSRATLVVYSWHGIDERSGGSARASAPPTTKINGAVAQQKHIEQSGMKWVAEFRGRSAELTDVLKGVKGFRAPSESFEREKTLDLGDVTDPWLAALDAMDALRPSHVVGSHYGMGGAFMVAAYREFLTARRARVVEMKAQGKSAGEVAKALRAERVAAGVVSPL